MPLDNEKKYLLDGEPITAHLLIAEAASINPDFANDWLKSALVAATILRENGQEEEA